MSKGDRDGRGFRHHKSCPSLNCDWCVNGKSKRPSRRRERRQAKVDVRIYDLMPAVVIPTTLVYGRHYS